MNPDLENELENTPTHSFAPVVLKLLQGPLYMEDAKTWALLNEQAPQIRLYFAQIGLQLFLSKEEGFAYLSQGDEDEGTSTLPRLVKRQPLGYEATVLAVLLRDALEEFDLANADSRDLFLTARDIKTRLMPYLGDKYDEARVYRQFERYILQTVRLGFLREVSSESDADFDKRVFQVMRILKAKLNPAKLEEIKNRILEYAGKSS